jgi:hypothetical protein
MSKQLASPFSAGGGGHHFESHVQASFVTLMLTGGHAPAMPCWPIIKIKLQGKVDGFDTDDFVLYLENQDTKEQAKLLGQIKHKVRFTKQNNTLSEVIQAAWNDFNNDSLFSREIDKIALITGPLNETDLHNVVWLLNQARYTASSVEFITNVTKAKFSPDKAEEKLDVFRHHLKKANNDISLSDDQLYLFLRSFVFLGYDLGKEIGVVLSLLHSHISQFEQKNPDWVWAKIVDTVSTYNQSGGTIAKDNLPLDLKRAFQNKSAASIPPGYAIPPQPKINLSDSSVTFIAAILGSWDDKNSADIKITKRLVNDL